jgi:DNA invertase Pin-like site-specific DNA recombinase
MRVIYARISTPNQNYERQLEPGVKTYIDICSGAQPFAERVEAKKLLKNLEVKEIIVDSIDRLGRNCADGVNILEHFTAKGVNIYIKDQGLNTILPNGKANPTALVVFAVLSAFAQSQKEQIKEKTAQGIMLHRAKGGYKTGRPRGSGKSREALKTEYKKIIEVANKLIPQGTSILELSKLLEGKASRSTIIRLQREGLIVKSKA